MFQATICSCCTSILSLLFQLSFAVVSNVSKVCKVDTSTWMFGKVPIFPAGSFLSKIRDTTADTCHTQPVTNKDLDLCQKYVILFRHNGTGIQRSRCMQHATAHHAFRAAMKLTAYVDRAGITNLMFSKILSFDCLTNSELKWIWFCSEGNSDDLLFVVHLKIFWLLL